MSRDGESEILLLLARIVVIIIRGESMIGLPDTLICRIDPLVSLLSPFFLDASSHLYMRS